MEALKSMHKPDRGLLLSYLQLAKECSRKDCSCVLRVLSELRLGDTERQLPAAHKILQCIFRL